MRKPCFSDSCRKKEILNKKLMKTIFYSLSVFNLIFKRSKGQIKNSKVHFQENMSAVQLLHQDKIIEMKNLVVENL